MTQVKLWKIQSWPRSDDDDGTRLVESRIFQFLSLMRFESFHLRTQASDSLVPEDPELRPVVELGLDLVLDQELGPVVEVGLDRPHRVEESCLNFCLTHQHQQMHLVLTNVFSDF